MGKKGVTLVWRTDLHFADNPPQSRLDDWPNTLLGKVKQVGDIAKKEKASAVLDGGDLFHLKSPSRNSHEMVAKMASAHLAYPCPTYSCVGNHDVKFGNLSFLNVSPLGVLFDTGVIRRLYNQYEVVFDSGGVKVRVVGIPYHGTSYDMSRFNVKKGDEDYLVVVAHVLASVGGGSMYENEDIVKYQDLVSFDPDLWLFGHWHKNQGVEEIGGKYFVNVGSLSRGSMNIDDLNRIPACVVLKFNTTGLTIKPIPLNVEDSSKVFNVQQRERKKENDVSMEVFVDNLKNSLVVNTGDSLVDQIRGLSGVDDHIRELALDYLEQASK